MVNFITKKDFKFNNGIPTIIKNNCKFPYPGVSKIVNHSKESTREILVKKTGSLEIAEKMFTKTEVAGRQIHRKLENNEIILPKTITEQLGSKVSDEVFCCDNLSTSYNVMGFADSLWKKDNYYIPVENKTKSNPKNWESHKKECFLDYVMQLIAYTKMLEKNYNLPIKQMGLIIFYRNQSYIPNLYLLNVTDFEDIFETFKEKLIEYNLRFEF